MKIKLTNAQVSELIRKGWVKLSSLSPADQIAIRILLTKQQ